MWLLRCDVGNESSSQNKTSVVGSVEWVRKPTLRPSSILEPNLLTSLFSPFSTRTTHALYLCGELDMLSLRNLTSIRILFGMKSSWSWAKFDSPNFNTHPPSCSASMGIKGNRWIKTILRKVESDIKDKEGRIEYEMLNVGLNAFIKIILMKGKSNIKH